jgi:hypothetical protein
MIYSNPGSTPVRLPIGTQGQRVTVDLTGLPTWSDYIVPSLSTTLFDDFNGVASPFADLAGWSSSVVSTGNILRTAGISPANTRMMGSISLGLSATAGSSSTLLRNSSSYFLGFGSLYCEMGVMIPTTIPDAANNYNIRLGLGDLANAESIDGVYFLANSSSGSWQGRSISNATGTTVVLASTLVVGQWYRLGFLVNTAGTLITFYVGGIAVGTINTNIPVGSLRTLGPILSAQGVTATGTTRSVNIDYYYLNMQFNAVRY